MSHSTWIDLERGRIKSPKLDTFIQLEILNERAALQNYRGIKTSDISERARRLEPILKEDGRPWGLIEFILAFVGRLDPPEWLQQGLTDEDAQAISKRACEEFRAAAVRRMITPKLAWEEIKMSAADLLDEDQLDKFQTVLSGWGCWTADDLLRQRSNNGYLSLILLQRWADG